MIVALIVFPIVFLVVLICVGLGMAFLETQRKRRVRQILWTADPVAAKETADLVRGAARDNGLPEWLGRVPWIIRVESLLLQAHLDWTPAKFLFTTFVCTGIGFFIGWRLNLMSTRIGSAAALSALGLFGPLLYVLRKRSKSLDKFEEQFPEALDFLSRSMRAGHGLSISLEILAKDAAEPLASSLRRVCHEMQLGAALNVSLEKMVAIVPLVDVRFFVSSVLLQQETGGNLSEILNKLSFVIRERSRLRGQVKSLSAHGRITGLVLLLMPVAVVLILLMSNPGYLSTLTSDKDGRIMLYGAIAGQVIAYFVINKIVNIKV